MMAAAAARAPPASPLAAAAAPGTTAATCPTYLLPKAKPAPVGVLPENLKRGGAEQKRGLGP